MQDWKEDMKVMSSKQKLKGTKIYIDNERNINTEKIKRYCNERYRISTLLIFLFSVKQLLHKYIANGFYTKRPQLHR